MEQIGEYGNQLVYNHHRNQIFLDDMSDTSESDSESDGGQDKIESDLESDGVQDKIIETMVVDNVTV